ncbi:HAD hydrolase family protein [Vulcanisaeta distributa]|uniref:HAD family hydrolase n=1 Tax=Vulcanisaeta distributa TaxID=164451 RepID=UPI0006D02E2A|nr:HAD hydrolase family protein [Vulcanisaeta distributa]
MSEIGRYIPIAVISTKDCDFLIPRTGFARAWSCTNGLEIRINNNRYVHEDLPKWQDRLKSLINAINGVNELRGGVYLEIKRVGDLIGGLGIDWRNRGGYISIEALNNIIKLATELGLRVIKYRGHPFIDVYPGGIQIDKSYAVVRLRELMGIRGPVMYMGDSENDIPAMKVVEYPIGIRHRYNEGLDLPVLLWVREDELPAFLGDLLSVLKSKVH